ncbi:MAG: hypothetical protein QW423_03220 [Candidatus Aenigmatarchaeota archaeon]
MPTITVFIFESLSSAEDIVKILNNKKNGNSWLTAKESKYSKGEVFLQYWYYEDVETALRQAMSEEDIYEIVSFLKNNGKQRVLKRTYCFINLLFKTLEVYRGPDQKTQEIVSFIESLLNVKFKPITLNSKQLQEIYSNHATELKQAMFKHVDGLFYEILKADCLEKNDKYLECLKKYPENLRVISFRPRIKLLNENNRYQVTINGDKGTIRLSSNEAFRWRPRFEIRQLISFLANKAGFNIPLNIF